MLPPETAHQKRSQLINDYKTACRALEKELKKKKLPSKQKDEIKVKLDQLAEEHERTLAEFDEEQGIVAKKGTTIISVSEDITPEEMTEPVLDDVEERNWNALSKRELEESCSKRGLSKKGSKEELVSRLTIWTLSHSNGLPTSPGNSTKVIKYETVEVTNTGGNNNKDLYRNKRKKLWKRRGPPPPSTGKKEGSSDGEEGNESGAEEEKDEEEILRERQAKREAVIAQVLSSILRKHPKGIKLEEMPEMFETFKVKNFTPELLGYSTLEDWIAAQPRDLLHYDTKSDLIYPPRVGMLPSASDDEEDD